MPTILVTGCIKQRKKLGPFRQISVNYDFLFSFQVLPFAHDLCLQFEMYFDPNHTYRCEKRHYFVKDDQPLAHFEHSSIAFRIVHFYSPVHYQVEIFGEKENDSSRWMYLNSQSRTVEVYLSDISASDHDQNLWRPIVFQCIFDKMYHPYERFECYKAKVMLKLKKILFVEEMEFWSARPQSDHKQNYSTERMSFMSDLYYQFGKSYKIRNRLAQMANIFVVAKWSNCSCSLVIVRWIALANHVFSNQSNTKESVFKLHLH